MNGLAPMGGGLMEQAEVLSRSNLVPKAFRGKPADVVVAVLLGQELGLGPMATMSYIDVIEGNATLNAEGKVALVRKAGHSISGEASERGAIAHGKRRDTGDEMTFEFTITMAQRAGLAGKGTWKAYPEAMLWSRAVSQLCRMLFPDVLAGLSYTPEEVEAFTGSNGYTPPPTASLPPANIDTTTGEVRTRRPPPQFSPVDCPAGCGMRFPSKPAAVPHLVAEHAWVVDADGKVKPPDAGPTDGLPPSDDDSSPLSTGAGVDGGGEAVAAAPPPSPNPILGLCSATAMRRLNAVIGEGMGRKPTPEERGMWAEAIVGHPVDTTWATLTKADCAVLTAAAESGDVPAPALG